MVKAKKKEKGGGRDDGKVEEEGKTVKKEGDTVEHKGGEMGEEQE